MKTTKVLLLGAVVAAFSFTSFAADALLSPRAAGNQIKVVSSSAPTQAVAVDYATANATGLAPRAQGNQIKVVKGTNNEVNPTIACAANMNGSPKTIQACVEHPGAMPACNPVTVAPLK